MTPRETKERLQVMLASNGFAMDDADPRVAWEVFKQFVRERVECADDTVSVHAGRVLHADGEQALLRLGRRFEINDEEKYYDRLEIVTLVFRSNPHNALEGVTLSTVGFRTLEKYFAAVESEAAFQAAVAHRPWTCAIEFWSSRTAS